VYLPAALRDVPPSPLPPTAATHAATAYNGPRRRPKVAVHSLAGARPTRGLRRRDAARLPHYAGAPRDALEREDEAWGILFLLPLEWRFEYFDAGGRIHRDHWRARDALFVPPGRGRAIMLTRRRTFEPTLPGLPRDKRHA